MLGAGTETEVRAVAVANASACYARRHGAFNPCAVICVLCARGGRQWERYEGSGTTPVVFGEVVVFTLDRRDVRRWSPEDLRIAVAEPAYAAGTLESVAGPAVRISLERVRFRPGERVAIGIDARNPAAGPTAELYVGIVPPTADRPRCGAGGAGDPIGLADATREELFRAIEALARAYPRVAVATPGLALSTPLFAEWALPVGAPQGTYRVFAVLPKPRAPRGPRIAPEHFVALSVRDVVVAP